MTSPRPTMRRRVLANLVRVALVAGVLPLLAPTCGNMAPGIKSFSRRSLIIPMDVCYQSMNDDTHRDSSGTGYSAVGCPQGKVSGDVMKAYGLVYQLIKADIAVYWIINNTKSATTDIDLSVQYNGGPPVFRYDWASGQAASTAPTSVHKIDYRGGPFVVDGSDFDRAVQVLNSYRTTFSSVNVHVSNVAFEGYVAKTMAGGWTAGGATAPKLALLDIGSRGSGYKNSYPVIKGYLTRAGLDFTGASGTATGTHGQIFDRLVMGDFQPTDGNWWTSNLGVQKYQVLWVPHWTAPTSCSDCTDVENKRCSPQPACNPCVCKDGYSAATIATALTTIGGFSAAGNDVFAECAGLGSFEGVFSNGTYGAGGSNTHFQTASTPPGFSINNWPTDRYGNQVATQDAFLRSGFASPLMQIGDFPFVAQQGAIADYQARAYRPGVSQFISYGPDTTWDLFSMIPPVTNGHGSIVYLAGHSYSGTDGSFQVAGARLVLNTLFNLGASCQATGVACNTGLLGECAQGVMSCDANGQAYCKQITFPDRSETCDGKDNDCNGLVDDGLDVACYDGPPGTRNHGLCHDGVSSCVELSNGDHQMSACNGQVLPAAEICNGLDDACTQHPDQLQVGGAWVPLTGPCYTGPNATLDPATGSPRGICKTGLATCTNGAWSGCPTAGGTSPVDAGCPDDAWRTPASFPKCQILPRSQICGSGGEVNGELQDMTCTGAINCGCDEGQTRTCYDGPPETVLGTGQPTDVTICHGGIRTCHNHAWGECSGQQTPLEKDCASPKDNDCNGLPDSGEAACTTCPAPSDPSRACAIPDACPGVNDKDPRTIDDDTPCAIAWHKESAGDGACTWATDCGTGRTCVDGLCRETCARGSAGCLPAGTCQNGVRGCTAGVMGSCSTGILPSVEVCDGKDNNCNGEIDEKPDTLCGPGLTCNNGVCVPRTCGVESPYLEGYDCESGGYTTAACGTLGHPCPAGQSCKDGQCIDRCATVECGTGDICSSGACTGGGCYLTGCEGGQVCQQGVCVPDPCAGLACPVGTFCRAGDCVQSCVFVSCPAGQVCGEAGFCKEDHCAAVVASCTRTQKCVDDGTTGKCVEDACATKSCGARQVCQDGACVDDPCLKVSCPVGVCSAGQCYPATVRDNSQVHTSSSGGGCGCGSGAGSPLAALLLLAAFPLFRRRRARQASDAGGGRRGPGGAGLLLLLALLALPSAGCTKSGSSSTDLTDCKATCDENRCIDLNYDPAHCGRCDTSCDAGEQCVDGTCGPSGDIAPRITLLSPDQGIHGQLDPVTVSLTGQRFAAGAAVRAISPSGTATYDQDGCDESPPKNCAHVVDASHVTVDLDLSDTPITLLQLRVVNPNHVISNEVPFGVTSASAHIDEVADELPNGSLHTPATVTTGKIGTLVLTGTRFSDGSLCHLAKDPVCAVDDGSLVLATVAGPGAGQLSCTLDATNLDPGTYNVWVVSDGLDSNCAAVTVGSAEPRIVALSPGAGAAGTILDVGVVGDGFDTSSKIYFNWNSSGDELVPTRYVDPQHLIASQYQLQSGTAQVTVHNGALISNAVTFASLASPPQVTGLSTSPTSIYQGDPYSLTFSGSNLSAAGAGGTTPTGITVVPPSGSTFTITPTAGYTATSVSGSVLASAMSGRPAGLYNAYLTLNVAGTTVTSSSMPFRVLSNVAVLASVSPAGGKQGVNPLLVTLTASNLRPPATVILSNTSGYRQTQTGSVSGSTVTANLDLRNLGTGTYALAVQNSGASTSNQLSFSVIPGVPALDGSPAISPSCVVQQPEASPNVTITLNGHNFAKPDARGNGGSQVMYSLDGTSWAPVPATVTVVSASQITATFDTRNAVPDKNYSVAVWNPPGPMKSAQTATLRVSSSTCP